MRRQQGLSLIALAVFLLTIVISLSACVGSNQPPEAERTTFAVAPTLALPSTESNQQTISPPTMPPPTGPGSSTAVITSPTATATQPPQTTPTPSTIAPSKTAKPPALPRNLQTTSGIVEYFNKALNDAKSNSKRATQNLHAINVNEISLGGVNVTMLSSAVNRDDRRARAVSRANIPVAGRNYGSRLKTESVAEAKCEIVGDDYVITIKIKPENGKIYQDNSYHGQVFTMSDDSDVDFYNMLKKFVDESEVDNAMIRMLKGLLATPETLRLIDFNYNYSGASVICRINRKTDKLQTSTYSIHQRIEGKSGRMLLFSYDAYDDRAYSFTW